MTKELSKLQKADNKLKIKEGLECKTKYHNIYIYRM